ncbi:hypothetical protein BHE74_00020701 [Ensete ventricosum]|nr:hypothetical protein BHE74_00020701 [Ensete ventricosum]
MPKYTAWYQRIVLYRTELGTPVRYGMVNLDQAVPPDSDYFRSLPREIDQRRGRRRRRGRKIPGVLFSHAICCPWVKNRSCDPSLVSDFFVASGFFSQQTKTRLRDPSPVSDFFAAGPLAHFGFLHCA